MESCCEWGECCSIDPPGLHGVGLWKYIRKGWRLFSSHIKFDPGDGSKTRFWDNVWCGELSLNEAFPILYNIACVKDTPIAVDLDCSSGSLQWNVSFIHLAHNWEVDGLDPILTTDIMLKYKWTSKFQLYPSPERRV